jgi:hypothetical protein
MPLDEYLLAQAHREAYRALIDSALPSRGDKAKFAQELGISPEYLSNLRNSQEDSFDYGRTPGPELTRKIATKLHLEHEQKAALIEHIAYVWTWEHRHKRLRGIEEFYPTISQRALHASKQVGSVIGRVSHARLLTEPTLTEMLVEVGEAREIATTTADPALARAYYRAIVDACTLLLARTSARQTPIEFVRICLLLHDAVCVLNRQDEGVFLAKLAREVIEEVAPGDYKNGIRIERGVFDHLMVNVVVAQCLAYRNLNIPKHATALTEDAERIMVQLHSPDAAIWSRHIYEHRLKAISELPRFSLRAVSDLAEQAREAHVRQMGEMNAHTDLRIAEAEARGYLRYGTENSVRNAYLILRDRMEKLDTVSGYGPVHKSHLLRTYASIHRRLGNEDGWAHYIRFALEIAVEAGLDHQIYEARRAYVRR